MSDNVLFAVPPDVLKCLCFGDKAIAVPSIRAFSPVPEENRSHVSSPRSHVSSPRSHVSSVRSHGSSPRSHGSSAHSHKTSTIKPIVSMGEKP